ncbi:MAG: TonB-dependent receptor [Bacteroidetes bacterium]|nr:TonB-dependent receptor [Bacteroidota bacterium]
MHAGNPHIPKLALVFIFLLCSVLAFAQEKSEYTLKGTVTDITSGEPVISAILLIGESNVTTADVFGNYVFLLKPGTYTIQVSYVGYESESDTFKIIDRNRVQNFKLKSKELITVIIETDMANDRETPVAFTNYPAQKIEEELAGQDLPLLLNSTPGVYATQQGGGDGDARINIRGFNQRNIAVMVDGIPVNDMENGWVYWSNWFGLADVTKIIQVQRGLGASKLAIASIGGTMNILTKGIESKRSLSFKQAVGNDMYLKSSIAFNSGRLKNGFGITFAGARKTGEGWVDQNYTDAWAYFLKIQQELKKHIITFTVSGAPQRHGQRPYPSLIAVFDKQMAFDLGADTAGIKEHGLKFNPFWGEIRRYNIVDGDTMLLGKEDLLERTNYYHKPLFSLKDSWNISDRLFMSNVVYMSLGTGGGTRDYGAPIGTTPVGLLDYQNVYDVNRAPGAIDLLYDSVLHKSSTILLSSVNNHKWFGLLSTLSFDLTEDWTLLGGVDVRSYVGSHYREVYDLVGGDYFMNNSDKNQPQASVDPANLSYYMKRVGDRILYYNDGIVKWAGLFAQYEYSKKRLSFFVTAAGSYSGYQRIDYFRKKDVVLEDTIYREEIGYGETLIVDSIPYTINSPEARFATTDFEWFFGYTLKRGVNYNITKHHNIYINTGYISKAPRFNNVFDFNNKRFFEVKNETVRAFELGYGYRAKYFSANLNSYLTQWTNKPVDFPPTISVDGETFRYNVNGIDALHKGLEMDFSYEMFQGKLDWEGLAAIGDWRWTSGDSVRIYDDNQNLLTTTYFSAVGVHVGDAAQFQVATSLRYAFIKNAYLLGKFTYFGKYFADMDPINLSGADADRESWQMPDYYVFDLHGGYKFKINKVRLAIGLHGINLLDRRYMADADNGSTFDATTATVFFAQGRRYSTSLKITL